MLIDLRSDTVTKPSEAMRKAMYNAEVGDDVFVEDTTVNKLEETIADMFAVEAALFCPSGTMTNQIAIKVHTQPGNEVICDFLSHIYQYEAGGIAFNSGCSVRLLEGNRGRITATQIAEAINTNDIHKAPTALVSLENTSNRGGGSCYSWNNVEQIANLCQQHQIPLHLDGARIFNALIATGQQAADYGKTFHSISVCLSKGLGAPIGSLLLGNKDFIAKARRVRKLFGGGMRQVGVIAAAGLYALQNNISRLQTDHDNAKQIANLLQQKTWVSNVLEVETNILIFEVKQPLTSVMIVELLKQQGIACYAIAPQQVRMVFHLDITSAMMDKLTEAIQKMEMK